MASMLQRWGWLRRRKGRSVLCLQLGPEDAEGGPWAPLFKVLAQRFPRLRCYSYGLAKGTPLGALPGPEAWPRLLLRAKAHGVFLSGGPSPPGLAEACLALSLPLFEAAPGGAWNAPEGGREGSADALLSRFERALAQGPARSARARRGDRLLRALARRRFERLSDLAALRAALGHPEVIWALGNGPSSEDPTLASAAYDSLFRVNHSWKARGFLSQPEVVFTGLRGTVAAVPAKTLLIFQREADFEGLLPRCAFLPGRRRFVTAEQLGLFPDTGGVFRPTNGAIMIAVAVALAPKRLRIAGMDLFAHPAGAYPGDEATPNAYTVAHDRQDELSFLAAQLTHYEGTLETTSPVLKSALAERGLIVHDVTQENEDPR